MLESNEFIVFLLAIPAVVFMFTSARRSDGAEYRDIWIMKLAFSLQLAAWFFTNFEAFFLNETLNLLEHLCESASAVFILLWVVRLVRSRRETAV